MFARRSTKLNAVLDDMDECFLPNGKRKVFSIGFVTKKGEYIYLEKAIKIGVRQNMKKYSLKGVVAVDNNKQAYGHRYPVNIHLIMNYKGNISYDRI